MNSAALTEFDPQLVGDAASESSAATQNVRKDILKRLTGKRATFTEALPVPLRAMFVCVESCAHSNKSKMSKIPATPKCPVLAGMPSSDECAQEFVVSQAMISDTSSNLTARHVSFLSNLRKIIITP